MNVELLRDRRVAPSILASDFARLGEQVAEVMEAGARVIHVDVMDGHFVPPITIGPLIVDGARASRSTTPAAVLDVHLMVERPGAPASRTSPSAGADSITVHSEATPHIHYALHEIREAGCNAGVAINPGTPVEAVDARSPATRPALCMTRQPRLGRTALHPASRAKIAAAARADRRRHADRGRRRHRPDHRRPGAAAGRQPASSRAPRSSASPTRPPPTAPSPPAPAPAPSDRPCGASHRIGDQFHNAHRPARPCGADHRIGG